MRTTTGRVTPAILHTMGRLTVDRHIKSGGGLGLARVQLSGNVVLGREGQGVSKVTMKSYSVFVRTSGTRPCVLKARERPRLPRSRRARHPNRNAAALCLMPEGRCKRPVAPARSRSSKTRLGAVLCFVLQAKGDVTLGDGNSGSAVRDPDKITVFNRFEARLSKGRGPWTPHTSCMSQYVSACVSVPRVRGGSLRMGAHLA